MRKSINELTSISEHLHAFVVPFYVDVWQRIWTVVLTGAIWNVLTGVICSIISAVVWHVGTSVVWVILS